MFLLHCTETPHPMRWFYIVVPCSQLIYFLLDLYHFNAISSKLWCRPPSIFHRNIPKMKRMRWISFMHSQSKMMLIYYFLISTFISILIQLNSFNFLFLFAVHCIALHCVCDESEKYFSSDISLNLYSIMNERKNYKFSETVFMVLKISCFLFSSVDVE